MFLELIVNATAATATVATQAMNYHMDTSPSSSSLSSLSPMTTSSSATVAAGATSPLGGPYQPYSDMTDYNVSSLSENGRQQQQHQQRTGSGLGDSPAVAMLKTITNGYINAHGTVSLVTCALGIPMNILNIWVLTRRHMRTPVNCILTWLAVFDLLTMLSYVPFSLHFYVLLPPRGMSEEKNSLGWMTFLIFHSGFTGTTHTISIWLGVTLAMFRYKHIFSPAKGHITKVRRLVRARIAVFVVVVASIVVMIPNYLMNRIMQAVLPVPGTNTTATVFYIEDLRLGTPEMKPMTGVNLWMQCILAKFLPCILMVVYSGLLVRTVRMNVRMLERRRTGSSALGRPSESYCGTRFSLAEPSSDGDSGNRKSVDLGRGSKDKKKKCKYQEMGKSEELGNGSFKKWFGGKNENGKIHNELNENQAALLVPNKDGCQYTVISVNGAAQQSACIDHEIHNCLENGAEQGGPAENHSHDSGIFSNSSHIEHMTYEQQCQLNSKQRQSHHVLCDSKKNNSSIKSQSGSNHPAGYSHQIHHPSHCVNQQRGSMPIVELGGGKRNRGASTTAVSAVTSRSQDSARTTRMLLVVIVLFLVTELPQGILIALSVTIPGFFEHLYIPLGDMMDQVALLNNGLNFLLYCSMSRDFRTTLLQRLEASPTWCLWLTRFSNTARQTECPGFKLRRRKRKQEVLANDV
ncbi:B1 bradykinin receptor [Elysia marginata]|uniref:B1 bradykinin receptor n=1 Tax=Elysia marginata TaxID=1093978 RepID=A0AAV4JCQ3_9GAST|nr:B1 bradykinin receptor [Elysia marginata]